MNYLELYNYSIFLLSLPLLVLGFVAMKYTRTGASRIIGGLFFTIATIYTFVIPLEFTGHPKLTTLEWINKQTKEAIVVWGGVHPDTKEIYVLLHLPDKLQPYYYKMNNFESEEEKMRMGESLQQALEESQQAKELGGDGTITMKYPFLSQSERKTMINEDKNNEKNQSLDRPPQQEGYEYTTSPFLVEPPPPRNPEKQ